MCGIVGAWGPLQGKENALVQGCQRMRHRGPDSSGYWEDEHAGIALGHVRLAILDLSPAGGQPMVSACQRYVLILNGEIYNHMQLREQLAAQNAAPAWRGHSDTETLLAAFAAWGVEQSLQRAIGMFALALWDRQAHHLYLARDRMGEKPLYMGYADGTLVFGSELKALVDVPGFDSQIDRNALALLLRHNYIPAPYSVYASVRKLMPGCWLRVTQNDLEQGSVPSEQHYWSAVEVADRAASNALSFPSDAAAVDALEEVLGQAVQGQMMADVPLGAFLSGGIDSSTIVALMQARSSVPVNTFSIGFHEPGFNEAEHARAVAQHLGTRHEELYVTAEDALAQVPRLARVYDEPFADSSQIPTLLVTQMARKHVTVALSGDGGDELFGGYSRYFRALSWWEKRQSVPSGLRTPMAQLARGLGGMTPGSASRQLKKLSALLAAPHAGAFYEQFVSYWKDPASLVVGATVPSTAFEADRDMSLLDQMTLLDSITYLPDDILVKVDRAAMAVSLETRVPMLDHRVFEFARRLPEQYKLRQGQGKWILRQLLYKHVPQSMVDRPKKGFGVPLGVWLRGPLRDWAANLLDPVRLNQQGLFRAAPVQAAWSEHLAGKHDWSAHLWGVLMAQAWIDEASGQEQRA